MANENTLNQDTAAAAGDVETTIANMTLPIPAPGQTEVIKLEAGQIVQVPFDLTNQTIVPSGNDLRIEFENGAVLVLEDFAVLADQGQAPLFLLVDGSIVPGDVILTALTETPEETAAGASAAGGGSHQYVDDMGNTLEGIDKLGAQDPDPFGATTLQVQEDEQTPIVEPEQTPIVEPEPGNNPPVASDDSYIIPIVPGNPNVTIEALRGLLSNDTDPDGDAITITNISALPPGIQVNAENGSLTIEGLVEAYKALGEGEESAPITFEYTISDPSGASDTATVSFVFIGVNDAPDAVNDAATVNEGGTVTVLTTTASSVLANDTDPDGDSLTVTSFTQGTNGTVTVNPDGTFNYEHNGSETTSDSFTYTISDGQGGTDTATVNITVNPLNDAPDAVNDAATVNEGGTVTVLTTTASTVLANDTDPDGDSLTVTSFTQGTNGTVTVNPDGTFNYEHNGSETTSDSFTYTISDGQGGTDTATVNITVNPLNDAPDAVNDAATVNEGGTVTVLTTTASSVLANDTDPDGDSLTVTSFTQGTNGTVTVNPDGTFNYEHNGSETTSDSFTYTISDGQGGTDTATVNITVNPLNDAPDAVNDAATVNEGGTVTVLTTTASTVLANDTDPDGDSLTVTSFTQGTNGTVTVNPDGTFNYEHNGSETTSDSFTYTISDGQGGTDTATVNITVNPLNDAPDAVNDSYQTNEDTPLVITVPASGVLANDSDVDGDTLSVTGNTNPTSGSVVLNADGTFTYTPNADFNGSDSFTYTISDGNGGTDTATVNITVNPLNDAPDVQITNVWTSSDPSQQPAEYVDGYPLHISIPTDVDGDNLTITAINAPAGVYYADGTALAIGDVLYNPAESINLLDALVYKPTSPIDDTPSSELQLNVFDGTVNVTQTVTITEALPTEIPGPTGELSSGNQPLTSGHNAESSLILNTDFVAALVNDPYDGNLIVSTNFQNWNIKGDLDSTGTYNMVNPADQNGNDLEAQVNVYLFVNGIQFQAVSANDGDQDTWTYNDATGLMKAEINFNDVHMVSDPGTSLADYLAINVPQTGDAWTIQYDDTTGGNEQARYVLFETAAFDPGDPGITVSGDVVNSDLIYGSLGSDHLSGNGGDDILLGRDGNDTMDGGSGGDFLIGGEGDDLLFGGSGADHFVFSANAGEGHDTIIDFNPVEDTLSFADLLDGGAPGLEDDVFASDYVDVTVVDGDLVLTIHDPSAVNVDTTVTLAGLGDTYSAYDNATLSDLINGIADNPTINADTYSS